jgi:hypothetical protein
MTSTVCFDLGDVRLLDEERRQLQKLSREPIEFPTANLNEEAAKLVAMTGWQRKHGYEF